MQETLWTTTGRAADFWPEIARACTTRQRRLLRELFRRTGQRPPLPLLFRLRHAHRPQP